MPDEKKCKLEGAKIRFSILRLSLIDVEIILVLGGAFFAL